LYDGQQFKTIEQLKERMQFVWNNFEQGAINGAINLKRRRLQEVVNNNGGHIHNILL
jgi:predicted acetyltransferase